MADELSAVREHCPSRDDLAAFASGRLREESSVEIAEHVGRCPDCESRLESHRPPFAPPVPRAGEFDHEPEARRMIAAAKALVSDAPRPAVPDGDPDDPPAESISTKTELDATEGFSGSVSETRTFHAHVPAGLGRYQIDAILGEGAFGKVFRAYDTELARQVAVKLSRPEQEAVFQQCLLDEARSAAQLRHAGIVSIYDVGRAADGATFVVMEYVDGQSLREFLVQQRPTVDRAVEMIEEIAKAVHYAHKRGLVHRDLKPGNVLIDRGGELRVADFGLALAEDQQRSRAGEFAGTPAYMSPEQARGEAHRLDGRTDVWALGVILYEMLTGRRPFHGRKEELLDEIQHRLPKPPRQYDDRIPLEVERICLKCLEKQPDRRYSTALDVAADLERWRASRSRKKPRWPMIAVAAAAACLGALGGGLSYLSKPSGPPGTSTLGAVSGPALDLNAPESLGRWLPLLERPPRPLFKPTKALERWHHDPLREELEISSPDYFLMDLGEANFPSYELKMTIAKAAPGGEAGVFLGFQPSTSRFGRPAWKCQFANLVYRADGKLIVSRGQLQVEEMAKSVGFSARRQTFEQVPLENHPVATLSLSVVGGGLKSLRWSDRPLLQLSDREPAASGIYKGRFGLVNYAGTTVFNDVKLLRSQK